MLQRVSLLGQIARCAGFNGHPPLWVNATSRRRCHIIPNELFQWAPTLVGECYSSSALALSLASASRFNGHPPLGVNATSLSAASTTNRRPRFNGHPPLGVNATRGETASGVEPRNCSFNGHPPLGVNATGRKTLWVGWR